MVLVIFYTVKSQDFGIKFLSAFRRNKKKTVLQGFPLSKLLSTNMSGNLSLLTVLFIMCYFIKKGENDTVTTITRAHEDYFTDVCKNCHKYGATAQQGICKCKPAGMGSVFLPDQSYCKDERDLWSK